MDKSQGGAAAASSAATVVVVVGVGVVVAAAYFKICNFLNIVTIYHCRRSITSDNNLKLVIRNTVDLVHVTITHIRPKINTTMNISNL